MGAAGVSALEGKVAVITGAATGIGRATAILFARAGARLILADARGDELARTVAEVRGAGGEAAPVVADLARPGDCGAGVAAPGGTAGRVRRGFHNPGARTMAVGGPAQ